ncbi:MAG: sugar ABC transporter permease [Clostridia bacterium]|nr:sugar ABC transporter permease [Clostridia bacterium]
MNSSIANPTKNAPMTKPVKKKRRAKSLDKAKARAGWFFVAPFVLVFFLVYVPVIVDSITYSFHTIYPLSGGAGFMLDPVGWQNYNDALFVDPQFMTTLTGGIKQLILEVPAIVVFSLFMAVMLNQKMVGRTFFRAVFFIPVILSTGLIDDIDMNNTFDQYSQGGSVDAGMAGAGGDAAGGAPGGAAGGVAQSGGGSQILSAMDLQGLFSSMKVGTELVEYVVDIVNDVYNLVNRSGVQMLIFLAGLQSISPAIYESCTIDGATTWETFWKITFPMISPMILVNAIYSIIDSFTSSSNQVMSYIGNVYNSAAQGSDVLATAMYWIYFALVILIVGVVALVMSTYVFYQRRD